MTADEQATPSTGFVHPVTARDAAEDLLRRLQAEERGTSNMGGWPADVMTPVRLFLADYGLTIDDSLPDEPTYGRA